MTSAAALARTVANAAPPTPRAPWPVPSRRLGELVPVAHQGTNAFGESKDQWATVVFQVLWWPPAPASTHPQSPWCAEAVVLLGEAFAPPMSSLGQQSRAFRLPVHRVGRRAPEGSTSWDEWQQEFLPGYLTKLHEYYGFDHQQIRRRSSSKTGSRMSARNRRFQKQEPSSELGTWHRPLSAIFGSAPEPEPASPSREPKALQHVRLTTGQVCLTPRLPEQLPKPEQSAPASWDAEGCLEGLPAQFRGNFSLDVDLAFFGPADPKDIQSGNEGVLAFNVHLLRVPPLDSGYVRVRVCEMAQVLETGRLGRDPVESCQINRDAASAATDSGHVLEAKMSARDSQPAPPALPPTRPLYSSPSTCLGTWAEEGGGDGEPESAHCCADWKVEGCSGSLWINPKEKMLRMGGNPLLRDAARESVGPAGVTLSGPPRTHTKVKVVDYQWDPVNVLLPVPLPRCQERMEASALLDPSSTLLKPFTDCRTQSRGPKIGLHRRLTTARQHAR